VDLWLNTPRRPWEACGTSGMKVLVNGGLNCSELDGWWAEAYSPETGWALGDGLEHDEDAAWDRKEADQLYGLLEREIVPEFYDRDEVGMPAKWIQRMRESMANLTPYFSANRAVREYTEQHYLPLAGAFLERSNNNGQAGMGILEWRRHVEEHWSKLRFGAMTVSASGDHYIFTVQTWLDELNPDAVTVELYADGRNGAAPACYPMVRGATLIGSEGVIPGTCGCQLIAQQRISRPDWCPDTRPRAFPWNAIRSFGTADAGSEAIGRLLSEQ
jgi:glycogen phosphorylase